MNRNMPKIVQGLEGKFIVGGEDEGQRQTEAVIYGTQCQLCILLPLLSQPLLDVSILLPSPRTGSPMPLGAIRQGSSVPEASRRAR